jgi:polysaccharide deacetylase 2 family uncharacterized protein YibQ
VSVRAPLGFLVLVLVAVGGFVAWSLSKPGESPPEAASGIVLDLKAPPATKATADKDAPQPPAAAHAEAKPEAPPPPPVARLSLPVVARGPALSPAPDEALLNRTELGPLPNVAVDGRKPWRVYARPFDAADRRPRVAIVIVALGLSSAITEAAIQGMPSEVTLAFAPYSAKLAEWVEMARAAGHEVLLNLPMEPLDYPAIDPGPKALLTSLSVEENRDRLLWTLSRGVGYVGVADYLGSRFSMSREHLKPVLEALNQRGLLYLDSRAAPRSLSPGLAAEVGIPAVMATESFDDQIGRDAIDAKLAAIERAAKKDGRAIGIGSPYPVTLERIVAWIAGLEGRGIALAPISAVVAAAPQ